MGKRKKGQRRRGSPLTISGEWGSSGLMLPADEPRAEATGFSEQEVIEDVQEKKILSGQKSDYRGLRPPFSALAVSCSRFWRFKTKGISDFKPKMY